MLSENFLSPVPFHGLPSHPFLFSAPLRAPSPLLLSIPIPPARSRDKYASYVWNAAILLADRIVCEEVDVRGKRVLELGCGLALPGLAAVKKGASKVVLSDYDDPLALADTAHAAEEALSPVELRRVEVAGHTWGESIVPLLHASPSYDLILVADCVWDPSLHSPLIRTLSSLLAACPSAVVHFAAGFHTRRSVVAGFLAAAEEAGVSPVRREEWVEVSTEGEERAWSWEDWAWGGKGNQEERQEERNRWTLYGTLGRSRFEETEPA
ncbi:hypothetical protein JCM10207_004422 [Rhodosporidiobolus poonsookiae]